MKGQIRKTDITLLTNINVMKTLSKLKINPQRYLRDEEPILQKEESSSDALFICLIIIGVHILVYPPIQVAL